MILDDPEDEILEKIALERDTEDAVFIDNAAAWD